MKINHISILLALFFVILVSCSSDDGNPTTPGDGINQPAKNYYPGGIGSVLKYAVDSLDSPNGTPINIGTRTSNFISSQNIGGNEIITQENQNAFTDTSFNSQVKFWRSDNGIYFLVDTAGLGDLISGLPDSLKNLLTFQIDEQLNAFSAPLTAGKSWSAFKFNVSIPVLAYTRTLVDVTAKYNGQEQILVLPESQNKLAERIDYIVRVSIPDINNLLDTTSQYFGGSGWFVENVGMVKLQGNAMLINAIGSGSIDFDDSTKYVQETLTEYNYR